LKTIILPVVLYGCETWCLTFTEKHRLRAFQNRVLRIIFEPKRDRQGLEEPFKEDLHNFYSSPSIISMMKLRRVRWTWHVEGRMVNGNAYRLLVGEARRKQKIRKAKTRWVNNI
jgi:hypothetical protein